MRRLFLFLIMLPLAGACDSDNGVTGNGPLPARVTVDLIDDFGEKKVIVEFDGRRYFSAYPSAVAPLTGPQASFVTFLDRGPHLLSLRWAPIKGSEAHRDSSRIEIGDGDAYFIGLLLFQTNSGADSLRVIVRDSPFGYL